MPRSPLSKFCALCHLVATWAAVPVQGSGDQAEPSVFACFAHHWFPAIMAAVLGSAEEAAEQGIHYLLLDACLTCLGWQALFPAAHRGAGPGLEPQIKLAADSLMDYLVRV